ncbi:Cytochrome c555 [Variovorax sp. SRS16]|uniref:c-type cytochrome n=1 Tax=Variovorax sp. SRS16 TaxID=282217 RepID=UPI0013161F14|nr:c-type cytochrome [Variovorax sp. SRS16]VTU13170.1 Cytochrome c555 [Variovorax sp. SRS16]
MSDAHNQATEDAHTGPIKNPKQLLLTVFFAFVAPIFIIMGLVSYVVSGNHPSSLAQGESMALYGVSKETRDRDVAARLEKIGSVEIRDANRPLATGEAVFKAQCFACHGTPGIPAAPHFSDAAAWAPRIGQGYATLLDHALHGKGMMPPQGGGDFEDTEIGRAVVYMADAGGAKFPVPDRPAAAGAAGAASDAASAPAADASGATPAPAAAASK